MGLRAWVVAVNSWCRASGFGACVALALVGCGNARQGECSRLISAVNGGLTQLEAAQQQVKNDPTRTNELRSMADVMDKTAVDTAAIELTTAELKQLSQRYQTMAKDTAKNAREVAIAYEKHDAEGQRKAQIALNDALKLEDPIIDDINKFCGAP